MKAIAKKEYLAPDFWLGIFWGSPTRKRLSGNFLSLAFLQAANYILPLITLPYLVRVLGPEKFGLTAFVQAFINYFVIFTDYGFNLSATKNIAVHRGNKQESDKIFSSVITVKIIFGIISFIILSLFLLLIPKFGENWIIYIFAFGTVVGNIIFPIWMFQGLEKLKHVAFLNIAAKLIFTVSIFFVVKDAADYIYVPLLNSLGYIFAGIISLCFLFIGFKIKFKIPTVGEIKAQLGDGWHVFISTVAVSLYTTSNSFILGLFTNNITVGYYSAAEKLIMAANGLLNPISQTIYPYISSLASKSKVAALNLVRRIAIIMGAATFILSLFIFICAPLIVDIILGDNYGSSVNVLRIMSFLPFMICLSNMFGIQIMLPFGFKKEFSAVIISAGIINISLALVLIPFLFQNGVALAWLITESLITISMFFCLKKKELNFSNAI